MVANTTALQPLAHFVLAVEPMMLAARSDQVRDVERLRHDLGIRIESPKFAESGANGLRREGRLVGIDATAEIVDSPG